MSFCRKPRRLFVTAAVLVLFVGLILCPDVSSGRLFRDINNNNNQNQDPPDTGNAVMVNAVSVATQQVTLLLQATSQKVVYNIDGGTTITVQGTAATLNQIHSGQEVYSYVERTPSTLDSIDVGPVRSASKN
jgi:hypothetical protein